MYIHKNSRGQSLKYHVYINRAFTVQFVSNMVDYKNIFGWKLDHTRALDFKALHKNRIAPLQHK